VGICVYGGGDGYSKADSVTLGRYSLGMADTYSQYSQDSSSLQAASAGSLAESGEALNTRTLKQIFQLSPIGMTILDLDGYFLSANRAFCEALHCTELDLVGRSYIEFTCAEDVPLLKSLGAQLMQKTRHHFQIETRHWNQVQAPIQASLTVTMVRDAQQRPICFLVQVVDLTERKSMEAQLKHHAFYDLTTGLANRALFVDRLDQALVRLDRRSNEQCAVLFLDLDRFKVTNESLGHDIGDALLLALSKRLEACIRRCDTLARFGGDEFAILLEEVEGLADVTAVCDRIHEALQTPFRIKDYEVFATISIGVVSSQGKGESAGDILRKADTALHQAKDQGGACHTVFEETMHQRAITLWQLSTQSQYAIERNELHVRYQPIMDIVEGQVVGLEALIRWNHPQHGSISPAEFIPVMEETGIIVSIGQWVLQEACQQARHWQVLLPNRSFYISVNVSPRQFSHPNLVEQIETVLASTGLDPHYLRLEITESSVIPDPEAALDVLQRLKTLGIGICLDDFGIGYSCLSRLQQMPIDTLKIDREFISHITETGENTEITTSIIELAHRLGLDVVAEGVETQTQIQHLQRLNCQKAQGFYFAKPLPAEAAFRFLQEDMRLM
jgi:diguanylate cyclase (GGDEF)-like protein/PAS domain S-box-containing protein